jgi:uncharacterized protein YeaO (DUF488 family)
VDDAMSNTYEIKLKRIYADAASNDGTRVLADRLWPRGMKKADAKIDEWPKTITPSNELRKSFHNNELTFDDFAQAYLTELKQCADDLVPLMRAARKGRVTLLSAVKDLEHSHLPVLRYAVESALRNEDEQADGSEPSSPVCFATSFTNNE